MEEPLVMTFYDLLERLTGLRMNEEQSDHLQVCLIYVTMDDITNILHTEWATFVLSLLNNSVMSYF
jgi:hypothetical protein